MGSLGEESTQDTAGGACLCSTMPEASAGRFVGWEPLASGAWSPGGVVTPASHGRGWLSSQPRVGLWLEPLMVASGQSDSTCTGSGLPSRMSQLRRQKLCCLRIPGHNSCCILLVPAYPFHASLFLHPDSAFQSTGGTGRRRICSPMVLDIISLRWGQWSLTIFLIINKMLFIKRLAQTKADCRAPRANCQEGQSDFPNLDLVLSLVQAGPGSWA